MIAPYLAHAIIAGTAIAVATGVTGYFLVLRSQVFTTDALGHVTYTGAMAGLAFAFNPLVALFVATVAVAGGFAVLGRRARADDVVIGSVFAWVLGLGALFQRLYTTHHGGANGRAGASYLFGSIFGISSSQATISAVIALAVCVTMVLIARPLLFASLDEAVAAARGVPVRLLGAGFLVVVGVTCAQAAQVVGALLLLGLISAPAGAAHRLTTRPVVGFVLAAAIAVASVWAGLAMSSLVPRTPPSFNIIAAATLAYLIAFATTTRRRPASLPDNQVGSGYGR